MKIKCNKCDERGYIVTIHNGGHSSRSCECGWAIEQSAKIFEGVSLHELLSYGLKRREEKEQQMKNFL